MPAFDVVDDLDIRPMGDPWSSYSRYLAMATELFAGQGGLPTRNRVRFAAAAWQVATSPVLPDRYVVAHPRILEARPDTAPSGTGEDPGRLAMVVDVAAPLTAPAANALRTAVTWSQSAPGQPWLPPDDSTHLTALPRIEVTVPIDTTRLDAPDYDAGLPDTATAARVVRTLCRLLTDALGGLITVLDEPR